MNGCKNRVSLNRRNYSSCNKIYNGSQNEVICSGGDEGFQSNSNTNSNNNFNFNNLNNNFSFNTSGNMGGNFNFPNFNNIFQNAGFNINFRSDINGLLNNLINQQNFSQSNSNFTQTFYEENVNNSEASSNEYVENTYVTEGKFYYIRLCKRKVKRSVA